MGTNGGVPTVAKGRAVAPEKRYTSYFRLILYFCKALIPWIWI